MSTRDNLHRWLAPVSGAAWADLEEEARRTFRRHAAARKVVDVPDPGGPELAAVGTGRSAPAASPGAEVLARVRESVPLVELEVPFVLAREEVDAVERGAQDADWQPVKDAVASMALAEDTMAFGGYGAAGFTGIVQGSSNAPVPLPESVREFPDAVGRALRALREEGVGGPYALLLDAEGYTAVSDTSIHGYPVRDHLKELADGGVVWAPALGGGLLVSLRGGDFEMRLGEDLSIGYLDHDATQVRLYLRETLAFLMHTAEASVALPR
ncbi:family 1 encapsulin nanocompartment shell protein [Nocardiopsis sp. RSe5-2]|uniref:Type 1 encapsulin shell protein n=1 Tax=Nocardiopsis endophytica TaxID=3018445 RepID=A0ABT4U8T4_9ACTN|nr:family 1 encapsulin nanocompartment shell protein [Nocardiopsis endophytica]MDA2813361.1 family 1 encapsulin nanocompartment shell protein [Nocardiopsis endophytica]